VNKVLGNQKILNRNCTNALKQIAVNFMARRKSAAAVPSSAPVVVAMEAPGSYRSVHQITCALADRISSRGVRGMPCEEAWNESGVRFPVFLYVMKALLLKNYSIQTALGGVVECTSRFTSEASLREYTMFAPKIDQRRALCTDDFISESYISMDLESAIHAVALSRERGLMVHELHALLPELKKDSNMLDRLLLRGLIIKRIVLPIPSHPNPRAAIRGSIFHLRRFAGMYNPEADGFITESDLFSFWPLATAVAQHLIRSSLTEAPIVTVAKSMYIYIGALRAMRTHLSDSREKAPVKFTEEKKYTSSGLYLIQTVSLNNAVESHEKPLNKETVMNLPVYEQLLVHLLNATDAGINTVDLAAPLQMRYKVSAKIVKSMLQTYSLQYSQVPVAKTVVTRIKPLRISSIQGSALQAGEAKAAERTESAEDKKAADIAAAQEPQEAVMYPVKAGDEAGKKRVHVYTRAVR
jgi:hypothetical protein